MTQRMLDRDARDTNLLRLLFATFQNDFVEMFAIKNRPVLPPAKNKRCEILPENWLSDFATVSTRGAQLSRHLASNFAEDVGRFAHLLTWFIPKTKEWTFFLKSGDAGKESPGNTHSNSDH